MLGRWMSSRVFGNKQTAEIALIPVEDISFTVSGHSPDCRPIIVGRCRWRNFKTVHVSHGRFSTLLRLITCNSEIAPATRCDVQSPNAGPSLTRRDPHLAQTIRAWTSSSR